MTAPARQVPRLYELQGLIVDMMAFDLGGAPCFDQDELDDYVEELFGIIKDAAREYKNQIGGYTL